MSSTLYIIRLVWPFLKELLLGGATLKEGMKTQKKMVFALFFICILTFLVVLIVPKFYQLSEAHKELQGSVEVANLTRMQKENQALKDKLAEKEMGSKSPPTASPEEIEARAPNPQHHKDPTPKPSSPQQPAVPGQPSSRKKAYMDFFDTPNDD